MKRFARLFSELDATTSTNEKVEALTRYFDEAPARDAAWAVYFLAGGKPRQVVKTASLVGLACHMAGIEPWLFDECYQQVGDLAETIALVLPRGDEPSDVGLAEWVEQRLLPLRGLPDEEVARRVAGYWWELDALGRFLLTKLVGGGFRVGVSRLLVQRALASHAGIDPKRVAQRMMGYTTARSCRLPSATRRWSRAPRRASPSRGTKGSPIRSSWPTSWTCRRSFSPRAWARSPTGSWNGSTTASAARSSSAAARPGCGRAARNW